MIRILISGGNSKFSKTLQKCKDNDLELIPLSKEEMDITDINSIKQAIEKYKPNIFIHTAALSRPMSLHSDHPDKSINTNIIGTSNCVIACMEYNVKLIYISTDFVYPGLTGNYSEQDSILPINKYAWSKLGGECACMLYDNSLILRTAMVEDPFPHDQAFTDVYKSSIWFDEAARIVLNLAKRNITGIINIGKEPQSIFNFAKQRKGCILPVLKQEIKENKDNYNNTTMDITKLKNIL